MNYKLADQYYCHTVPLVFIKLVIHYLVSCIIRKVMVADRVSHKKSWPTPCHPLDRRQETVSFPLYSVE